MHQTVLNQKNLHQKALLITSRFKKSEGELILVLQELDLAQTYKHYGCNSLFAYTVKYLGLSDDAALMYINVARKAAEVPALHTAILNFEITVSKAKKMTSVINTENQDHWLGMAKTMTQKNLEKEVAKVNPKAATPDKASYVSEKRLQLSFGVDEELFHQFKRVLDLESQRQSKAIDYEAALKVLVDAYLKANDPLQKQSKKMENRVKKENLQVLRLRRNESKNIKSTQAESNSQNATPPQTLSKGRKNFVLRENEGQCIFVDSNGNRCQAKRFLHIHHKQERSNGGTHATDNLTVLCSVHHRFLHQENEVLEFEDLFS